jgi:hypothetical protein
MTVITPKTTRQRSISFIDGLYKVALVLVIGGDRSKFLEKELGCKKEYVDISREARCEGMYFRVKRENNTKGYNLSVIWIKNASIPQLTHELVHFCNSVFIENGIAHTLQEDEAFCYYLEYWLSRIGKRIKLKFL